MKILITGASGFVGKNVKEYLAHNNKGYDLYCPTSKELDCIDGVSVKNYLVKHKFDYILHFAYYGDGIDKSKDGTKIMEYNLRMFHNFAANAHLFGKMYYAGSGAEYDKRIDLASVKEEQIGKSIPTDTYGLMKYTIGRLIEGYHNIYNLRLFGIFGKHEYYPLKYISNLCCKAIKGLPLSMKQNAYFDYLWVEDFVKMIEWFLHHEPLHHTYNMVSGMRVSLVEICNYVNQISGKNLPVYVCKEGLANEYTASNDRLRAECSQLQLTPIENAIEELFYWYKKNEDKVEMYSLLY